MGDLTWLTSLGDAGGNILAIGVLILVWRREARRADRWERATGTALAAVAELKTAVVTLTGTTQRLMDVVAPDDGGGRHRWRG